MKPDGRNALSSTPSLLSACSTRTAISSRGLATRCPFWACYHTELHLFTWEGIEIGVVGYAVGASFAVLVAEELFASGCELLISVTSSGQIAPVQEPPYFILIEKALRDEGTSYHYLPPTEYSHIPASILPVLEETRESLNGIVYGTASILCGATWTTDAPFRETQAAIDEYNRLYISQLTLSETKLPKGNIKNRSQHESEECRAGQSPNHGDSEGLLELCARSDSQSKRGEPQESR